MAILGRQFLITLKGCGQGFVEDPDAIIAAVTTASNDAGLKILKTLEHRFEPQGLTFILLLAQSHLLIHTWPEYCTMIVDVFVCTSDFEIDTFVAQLETISGAVTLELKTIVFEHELGD